MGRPPLEDAGVQLVDDVESYESMKLRLLNASHQAMSYLSHLAGDRFAHEVSQDPLFARFLLSCMDAEATPTLAPVPASTSPPTSTTLLERFANPEIRHTLARLRAETSDRIPKFLLPVIRHQLATGGAVERSALVIASWVRYVEGIDEQGKSIDVVDRLREPLMAAAARQRVDPVAFLAVTEVLGDLINDPRFVAVYSSRSCSPFTNTGRASPWRTPNASPTRAIAPAARGDLEQQDRCSGRSPATKRTGTAGRCRAAGRPERERLQAHVRADESPVPAGCPRSVRNRCINMPLRRRGCAQLLATTLHGEQPLMVRPVTREYERVVLAALYVEGPGSTAERLHNSLLRLSGGGVLRDTLHTVSAVEAALFQLQREGLTDWDSNVAQFDPPGSPPPLSQRYWRLTEAGRRRAARLDRG